MASFVMIRIDDVFLCNRHQGLQAFWFRFWITSTVKFKNSDFLSVLEKFAALDNSVGMRAW
jgi:hypothetical protein